MKKNISLLASSLIVLAVCFISCDGSSSSKGSVEREAYANVQDDKQVESTTVQEEQVENSIVGKWETNYKKSHMIITFEESGDFFGVDNKKGQTYNVKGKWSRNGHNIYFRMENDKGKTWAASLNILSLDKTSLVVREEGRSSQEDIYYFTRIE